MSETHVPLAPRLKRPSWRDPRLVFGVLIVVCSLLLGGWVISRADVTVGVYAATGVILPGQVIADSDVTVQRVNLGRLESNYVLADEPWPAGVIAQHTINSGDLVAQGSFAVTRTTDVRPIALNVPPAATHDLNRGDRVEVWFVPEYSRHLTDEEGQATPTLLVDQATVSDISASGGGLIGGGQVTVHLLIPTEDVPQLLAAQASTGDVTIIALPGELP